jgi:sec-independent protein translocase protein TatA
MLSLPHLLLVLAIVLLVFGTRLPKVMGDIGKGIRSFRDGLKGDENKKIEDKNEDQDKRDS